MRKCRQYSESGLYHAIIRGVNKEFIFYDDKDRNLFISLMKKYTKKYGIDILVYCLLDNHVHLLIEDTEKKISRFMQTLSSVYARKFNKKYDRIGHLYQDRFISEPIEDDTYLMTAFRYIIQNPEKAGLGKIEHYKWSSYKEYSKKFPFAKTKPLLDLFGDQKNLYSFLHQSSNDECLDIGLRPSEKKVNLIRKVMKILNSDTPIIPPELPEDELHRRIYKLKEAGFSIRLISQVTHLSRWVIKRC